MGKKFLQTLLVGLMALSLVLGGCGGSGSSGKDPVLEVAGGVGIAVDPYIEGARFQEIDPVGKVIQSSGLSDAQGRFEFELPLSEGNRIVMMEDGRGFHNGVVFNGKLERFVDSRGELVASPLTTLLAKFQDAGMDAVEAEVAVLEILKNIEGMTPADLKADPMKAIAEGQVKGLVANIAVNAALVLSEGKTGDALKDAVADIVTALAPKIISAGLTKERLASGQATQVISAVVAVADVVVAEVKKDSSANVVDKIGTITDAILVEGFIEEAIKEAETKGGNVSIVIEDGAPKSDIVSVSSLLKKGYDAFDAALDGSTAKMIEAAKYFQAAAALVGTDAGATQQDKDAAYFFSAFSHLVNVGNPNSASGTGLENIGDILTAFGFDANRGTFTEISTPQECETVVEQFGSYQKCDFVLPETTPTTGELQQFLFAKVGSEILAAVAQFDKVSESFKLTRTDPADDSNIQFDYGDVLVLKGGAKAILAQLYIQQAYDFNVDIYEEDQKASEGERTIQAFLTDNPKVGSLKDKAKLVEAKTFLISSIDLMLEALDFIEEDTDKAHDLIQMDAEEIAITKADLLDAKDALTPGNVVVVDEGEINVNAFFNGIDIRNQLPSFAGDKPGFFRDPTLGGLLSTSFNLNRDLDGDGSPDILMEFTQFSPALMTNNFYGQGWSFVHNFNSYLTVKSDGAFTMNWQDWSTYPSTNGVVAGNWSVSNGKLTLTNSDVSSTLFSTMIVEMENGNGDIGSLHTNGQWTMRDASGANLKSGGLYLNN